MVQEDVTYGYMGSTNRRYLLKDHLGSTTAITNEAGTIEERLSFNTWGERRAADWSAGSVDISGLDTTRGFTGHEMLDDSGLIHMNGRVYDPTVGRFLSADILIQAPTNTQSYNRYSYVFNNPLSFTDPSGYEGCTINGAPTTCDNLYQHAEDLGGASYTESYNGMHLEDLFSAAEGNISYAKLLQNRSDFSQGLKSGSVTIIDNPKLSFFAEAQSSVNKGSSSKYRDGSKWSYENQQAANSLRTTPGVDGFSGLVAQNKDGINEFIAVQKVYRPKDAFVYVVHGNRNGILLHGPGSGALGKSHIWMVASAIKNSGYKGNKPLFMISCNIGDNGMGSQLSKYFGQPVIGANTGKVDFIGTSTGHYIYKVSVPSAKFVEFY
ncbi:MAG: RHS repeat domain-containing protein [Thalassotalea sp.]